MSEAFWIKFWQTIVVGVVCVAAIIAGCETYKVKLFVRGGYTSCQKQGSTDVMWCFK